MPWYNTNIFNSGVHIQRNKNMISYVFKNNVKVDAYTPEDSIQMYNGINRSILRSKRTSIYTYPVLGNSYSTLILERMTPLTMKNSELLISTSIMKKIN